MTAEPEPEPAGPPTAAELEGLAELGRWEWSFFYPVSPEEKPRCPCCLMTKGDGHQDDCEFVAARNALPRLLAAAGEAARLRESTEARLAAAEARVRELEGSLASCTNSLTAILPRDEVPDMTGLGMHLCPLVSTLRQAQERLAEARRLLAPSRTQGDG